MKEMITYYRERAKEHDLVYAKPERQKDLTKIKTWIPEAFADLSVLEIACGTGYWTAHLAQTAQSIHAFDINPTVLEIAKTRDYGNSAVHFSQADYNQLGKIEKKFQAIFGGFIWSHIPRQRLSLFLKDCFRLLTADGKVIFIDNKYVTGNSTPIHRKDDRGNSYQMRQLEDGRTFEVLKNYPERREMEAFIVENDASLEWLDLEYYWAAIGSRFPYSA